MLYYRGYYKNLVNMYKLVKKINIFYNFFYPPQMFLISLKFHLASRLLLIYLEVCLNFSFYKLCF